MQLSIKQAIIDGRLYVNAASLPDQRTLLVFVPGWTLAPKKFVSLLMSLVCDSKLADVLGGCDILPFRYANSMISNIHPSEVASNLATQIQDAMVSRRYNRIYLMGHSIGALLLRAALLVGKEESHPWTSAVRRLVLLAGTNRGFMPGTFVQKLGAFIVSLFNLPIARLIMEAQIGSEWVTSLRLKWLRTFAGGETSPPEIVQLYGEEDLVVAADDSLDINRYDNSVVERLAGIDHEGFCHVDENHPSYEKIQEAFSRKLPSPEKPRTKDRHMLVFLIHGIRDFAEWHYALDYEIETRDEEIEVIPVQYGYFNILQFLLPHQQRRAVRVFVDKYVQEVSLSPKAKIAVAAHSNGTRVSQQALAENDFIQVDRAYFAGSVVPTNIPWSREPYHGKVRKLRNDCATKDIPVGILCSALKWTPIIGRGLGTAGFHGFQDEMVHNQFIDGGHGAALKSNHREFVARYLIGIKDEVSITKKAKHPRFMRLFSKWAPLAIVIFILILLGIYTAMALLPNGMGVLLSAAFTFMLIFLLQWI